MTKMEHPTAGVFEAIPHRQYLNWSDYLSQSSLGDFIRAPRLYKWNKENPETPDFCSAFDFGSAFHCAVLTPDKWNEDVLVLPETLNLQKPSDRKLKAEIIAGASGVAIPTMAEVWGRREAEAETLLEGTGTPAKVRDLAQKGYIEDLGIEALKAGARAIITADQAVTIGMMRESVFSNPAAKKILEALDFRELSIRWEYWHRWFKARLDGGIKQLGWVVDLKSSKNCSPRAFEWSIVDYGYHRQAAAYSMPEHGAATQVPGFSPTKFIFICCEKEPPFLNAVYDLNHIARQIGHQEIGWLLDALEKSEKSGYWPGYSDDIMPVSIPGPKIRSFDTRLKAWIRANTDTTILDLAPELREE